MEAMVSVEPIIREATVTPHSGQLIRTARCRRHSWFSSSATRR